MTSKERVIGVHPLHFALIMIVNVNIGSWQDFSK
jgi:TRAP-type C4-dicarboxylate transport system permease large subunit